MSSLANLQIAKRAAKVNPTCKVANVYSIAQENGTAVMSAEGAFEYDLAEVTFGYADPVREDEFTATPSYKGNFKVVVLSELAPNGAALILLGGTFYAINTLVGGDPQGVHLEYDCFSLGADEAPTIRNNTL